MPSEVSICNRALAAAGTRSTISSLTENSAEAEQCAMIYEDTRDELTGMAFWNFARKTATLGLLKSAPGTPTNQVGQNLWSNAIPAPPWAFEYAYPTDCLQVQGIIPQVVSNYGSVPIFTGLPIAIPYAGGLNAAVPFIISTDTDAQGNQMNVILTNQYLAIAVYTMRITNPELWNAQFTQALVLALAAKLAMPLTGDKVLANGLFMQANAIIIQARETDGNEGLTVINNMPDWLTCRDDMTPYSATGGYIAGYNPVFGTIP